MSILVISYLDIYKLIFTIALLVAEGMLLIRMPRREHFPLRLLVSILTQLALAFFYPSGHGSAMGNSLMFAVFYLFSLLCARFCFNVSWRACLFCTVAGYSIQHIASIFFSLINLLGGFGQQIDVYSTAQARINLLPVLIFLEAYAIVYWCTYMVYIRHINTNEDLGIRNPQLLNLMLLLLVVEIIINSFVVSRQSSNFDFTYHLCASLTNMLCSICVLIILFNLLLQKNLREDLKVVQQLREQERRQYNISKETIDMINIKCHDMRHQIHAIRKAENISPEALKEVEQSIRIYDAIVKTGSVALDVILAEKSLFCQKNGVSINCIVDGERLAFMSEQDIYSLFGNLLDNAIHSVLKLDEEQRNISLTVKARGKLLSVHISNPYDGELRMNNGIPQTLNQDTTRHGFGIRSIIMTVEKYDGTVGFDTQDQLFSVKIMFPLKDLKGVSEA